MMDETPEAAEDRVTLVVEGREFFGWTAVEIDTSLVELASTFAVACSGVYATGNGQIVEGDDVEVYVGAAKVITGVAEDVLRSGTGTTLGVQVSGRSRTRNIVDCSARLGTWHKQRLGVLARTLLESYQIDVVDEVGIAGEVVQRHRTEEGETLFDAFDRLLRDAAALQTDDAAGRLVWTRAGAGGRAHDAIVRGSSTFLSGEVGRSVAKRFSDYACKGQGFTDLDVDPHVQGGARDVGVREFRELILRPERGVNAKTAAARARWEATRRAAQALTAEYELRGWRQRNGELWRKNQLVMVTDGHGGLEGVELLIVAVKSVLDNRGRRSLLRLAPQDAYTPPPGKLVDVSAYATPLELESTDPGSVGLEASR